MEMKFVATSEWGDKANASRT